MNYLLKYYEEIESGRIKAGLELKTMLKRLVDDLSNPRYEFDEKPGNLS